MACKQGVKGGSKKPQDTGTSYQDSNVDDTEEGEFLSNNEEEEACPDCNIACFFSMEDYQYLLCKSLFALDLKEALGGEETQDSDTHHKNKSQGSGEFFSKGSLAEKVFPFPVLFEKQLEAEWAKPAAYTQSSSNVRKLYNLTL